jgi:hypothetical protein
MRKVGFTCALLLCAPCPVGSWPTIVCILMNHSAMRTLSFLIPATLVLAFFLSHGSKAQTVITEWTFDGANSASIPGGSQGPLPATGSGTAHPLGGIETPGFNNGNPGPCGPADGSCGWQTTGYPSQSSASGTAGVEFRVSTLGFRDISFEYDHRASDTSSRWARIEYMTDGCTWNVLGDNGGALSPHDNFYSFSFDLSS